MKFELENMVQRGHVFAIVDEVDSILIDEARTPLIISGPSEENTDVYYKCNRVIPHLVKGAEEKDKHGNKSTTGDYLVDEKARTAVLTEEGVAKAEKFLGIDNMYELQNIDLLHGVEQALRAHALYKRDVDYMIKDGQVLIVDEFTGRVLPGRRWSDGLHQAVEAKENVKIERENQTLATITLQNYFRLYEKLSGMTGTADTEAAEFHQIYKLDVVVIPTNQPMIRADNQDVVYASEREKYEAVADEIVQLRDKGQPVLVGTVSIEKSERLSDLLKQRRVPHVVLNAKFHEKEAEIVAQAGRSGAVTIATNMAGRGTDIVLGGNAEAVASHELREIEDPAEFERRLSRAARLLPRGQGEGPRRRRPPHHRHRAPRVAPRRQPAARPVRPPGRPRLLALLPVARGRPDAHLRVGPAPEHHAQARHGGRRPDRARHGLPVDRARPEAGRGPELREPQAPARVRRRHEPAARGDLRHAPPDPRGRNGARPRPASSPRRSSTTSSGAT